MGSFSVNFPTKYVKFDNIHKRFILGTVCGQFVTVGI